MKTPEGEIRAAFLRVGLRTAHVRIEGREETLLKLQMLEP